MKNGSDNDHPVSIEQLVALDTLQRIAGKGGDLLDTVTVEIPDHREECMWCPTEGHYAPLTQRTMLVVKRPDGRWSVGHISSGIFLQISPTLEHALNFARAAYDAAVLEGLPIADGSMDQMLEAWPVALKKHTKIKLRVTAEPPT
jgi:hypothetical protein